MNYLRLLINSIIRLCNMNLEKSFEIWFDKY